MDSEDIPTPPSTATLTPPSTATPTPQGAKNDFETIQSATTEVRPSNCPQCLTPHEVNENSRCPHTTGKTPMQLLGVTSAVRLIKMAYMVHQDFSYIEYHIDFFPFIYSLVEHLGRILLDSSHRDLKGQTKALENVCEIIAGNWTDEKKLDLINQLSANGCFVRLPSLGKWPGISAFQILSLTRPTWFPPYVFLWMIATQGVKSKSNCGRLMPLIEKWDKDEIEGLMLFLEDYLRLPTEEKMSLIESYPFFCPKLRELSWADDTIDLYLRKISWFHGISLTQDYFTHQRTSFVQQLLACRRECILSTDGAAQLVVRHLGESSHRDKCDAVLLLASWPRLAAKVKSMLDLSIEIPKYQIANSLASEIDDCVDGAHDFQIHKSVSIIRTSSEFERIELELRSDEIVLVHVSGSAYWSHPNKLTNRADLVSFKSYKNSHVYAFSPTDIPNDLRSEIFKFLSSKIVFALPIENFRIELDLLPQFIPAFRLVDSVKMVSDFVGGPRNDLAQFVWARPHCDITREDLFTELLTPVQEFHIAYYLNIYEEFINKLGVSVMHESKYQIKIQAKLKTPDQMSGTGVDGSPVGDKSTNVPLRLRNWAKQKDKHKSREIRNGFLREKQRLGRDLTPEEKATFRALSWKLIPEPCICCQIGGKLSDV